MNTYRLARNWYHRLLNRDYWRHRQARRELFRPFVPRGSLVFDIGANRGEVSETFLELGARTVVAVEPNASLADDIRRRYGRQIHVENVAVGAEPGQAELIMGRDPGHSTLSTEWMARAPTHDRWAGTALIEVTTLDALVEKYGRPDFVKIDVEAYEAEVLTGLGVSLKALCFEYQVAYPEVVEQCLALLGDGYEYALTLGEKPILTTAWIDGARVLEVLKLLEHNAYGDVFARLMDEACGVPELA
jgi:FkbM family methyltransferase